MGLIYAGVGSQKTPPDVCNEMVDFARLACHRGWLLRSGAADGADTAFETGHDTAMAETDRIFDVGDKEIYLPWDGFNNRSPKEYGVRLMVYTREAVEIAAHHHPKWSELGADARKLHVRNVLQILGEDLKTPVRFVACWTPNASGRGGTGQAIRIAHTYRIPVYDMGNPESRAAITSGVLLK